jgi:superfamily II DNA or RNA helicase
MSLHQCLTKLGYALDKNKIDDIKSLKKDLTMKPHNNYVETEEYRLYRETKEYLYVPKYFGIDNYGKFKRMLKMNGEKSAIQFNGKLRDHQKDIVDQALNQLSTEGGGILSLYCGGGKTVIALYMASILKVKTLVIVNKTPLLTQWKDRIESFTDAKVGILRQKKIEIEGKDIVIGMLQSISLIDYDTGIFKGFGLVIYDEVHRYASKCFEKALFKTSSKYTLGLSATPDRPDGMTKVLKWYIGDIFLRIKRDTTHNHKVKTLIFKYKSIDKLFVEKKTWNAKRKKRCPNISIMTTNICNIKQKNKNIIDVLESVIQLDDRRIIVLSSRVQHVIDLKSDFDKRLKKLINNEVICEDEITTALYYSDLKKYELKYAEDNGDILFATFQMAQEGLDLQGLNTVIFASPPPKTDIEQSVGRGLRAELETCEVNPILIDFADQLSILEYMSNSRSSYYEKQKYDISTYYIYDKLISEAEYIKKVDHMDDDELNKYLKMVYKNEKAIKKVMKKPPTIKNIIMKDLLCD